MKNTGNSAMINGENYSCKILTQILINVWPVKLAARRVSASRAPSQPLPLSRTAAVSENLVTAPPVYG
jgi:hypothetical protein